MQNNQTKPYLLLFRLQSGELIRLALNCVRFLIGLVLGITARETSRSGTWYLNVLNLLLFGYAARANLFSPIKKLKHRFKELHLTALHAYIPPRLAVKTMSAPNGQQRYNKNMLYNSFILPQKLSLFRNFTFMENILN